MDLYRYPPSTKGRSSFLLVDTRMACFCNPLSCKNYISVLKFVSSFASWLLLVSLTTILMREEQSFQNPRSINVKIKMAQSTQLYIYIFTYGYFCYCVTQLMLYTGDKLSSPIFCCLWVCQASVTPDQISTFFNIYRHTSPLLTMYHLISSSIDLYWPSTSQYRHILTQYHL